MAFDRSKFKPASVESYSKETKEAKKNTKSFGKSNGRSEYFSVKQGRNEFRLLPPHKAGEPPFRAIRTVMLKCEKDVWEEGKKTGKKEVKLSKVFIATQHSDILKEDIIEFYIKTLTEKMYDEYESKEAKAKLKYVYGYRTDKWNMGILPSTNYMFYAKNDENKIGTLELYDKITKQMENVNLEYQSDDDVIGKDIFTDPDEGHPIIIKKQKEDGKWNYIVDEAKLKKGQTWEEFYKENRVSDEILEGLQNLPSLTEKFVNVYTTRDFDLALDGLKRFDEEHGYDIIGTEEFLDKAEELYNQCPKPKSKDDDDSKETQKPENKSETKKEVKQEKKVETKSDLTTAEKREFLKDYIEENYGKGYSLPKLKIKEVKAWYELALKEEDLPFDSQDKKEERDPLDCDEENTEFNSIMGEESDIDPAIQAEIEKLRKASQE